MLKHFSTCDEFMFIPNTYGINENLKWLKFLESSAFRFYFSKSTKTTFLYVEGWTGKAILGNANGIYQHHTERNCCMGNNHLYAVQK